MYSYFAEMYFFLPSQHSQVFTRLKSLISSEIDFVVNQNYNKISARDWFEHQ